MDIPRDGKWDIQEMSVKYSTGRETWNIPHR